jgi:hypothetical protein
MNKNRRDFLKKATLGSIAITSAGSLSVFEAHSKTLVPEEIKTTNPLELTKPWEISFNEVKNELSLINGPVKIKGQINFYSEDKKWTISNSRDGVLNRYALIDTNGNVQGYFVLNPDFGQVQFLFYHRTAQAYEGELTFEGTINYLPDSFACRTKASVDERVLSMSCGNTDSILNDSLFSPEKDAVLQLNASNIHLKNLSPDSYSFYLKGYIHKSSEAIFSICFEEDYFKNRYVPYYQPINRDRCPKAPTGWMSWNTYFDKANAEDNLAEAKVGQKFLLPFGCEIWSIESWQGNSDQLPVRDFYNMNLEVNEKQFPKGMKQLADDIRKLGFKPGIWMAPFGTGNNVFYQEHKHWFLHDKAGDPISSWNGRYTLDPTVKEAREHLKEIFRKASREWGYEFFKVDGMSGRSHGYCAHLYERPEIKERFQDPSCPNPFELCVQSFREGMGEDRIFLACQGHSSGPEAKYADASRIGADIVHPNKPVQWNNVLNQARCTINQTFTHNIVMVNDPDTLLVADLPIEEARVSTTIVALPGQLTFFGDKLANLSANKMKLLQQTLPVANVRPGSLYPYFSMLSIWNLNIHNDLLGDYNIVALFNWEDELKEISFTTEELGIDSNIEYSLFEFWTEKYFGEFRGTFSMNVPPHNVRLLAIHKIKQIPQWISSDRHVTQNALELKGFEWNDKARTITGKIELIDTFPLTMRIRIPKDYSFKKIECKDLNHSVSTENNDILAITFIAKKKGYYSFILKF